jgi:hypothetical protein
MEETVWGELKSTVEQISIVAPGAMGDWGRSPQKKYWAPRLAVIWSRRRNAIRNTPSREKFEHRSSLTASPWRLGLELVRVVVSPVIGHGAVDFKSVSPDSVWPNSTFLKWSVSCCIRPREGHETL